MNKTQAYSTALYAELAEHAESRTVGGVTVSVWKGSLVKTCRSIGVPKGTERRVVAPLEYLECIQILQRGVANVPSTVVLLKPPTEEMWEDYDSGLTSRPSLARLSRQVEDISRQLGGVNLAEALLSLDRRLTAVESTISDKSETVERS